MAKSYIPLSTAAIARLTQGEMIRALLVILFVLLVAWPTEASACSCRYAFGIVSSDDRVFFDQPINEDLTVPLDTPVILILDGHLDPPDLYRGQEQLEYDFERLEDHDLCGGDLVAVTITSSIEPGDELKLVSPQLQDAAAEYELQGLEVPEEYRPIDFRITSPDENEADARVFVSVRWERTWAHTYTAGACSAGVLTPYEGQGVAEILVSSQDEVEFYVAGSVTLPEGETYQHTALSRFRVDGWDDPQQLPGSEARLWLPLTSSADTPECVEIRVYNHRFEPVFEEEMCPQEPIYDEAYANTSFDARLALLPDFPELNQAEDGGACTFSPTAPRAPSYLSVLLLLGLAGWRRHFRRC